MKMKVRKFGNAAEKSESISVKVRYYLRFPFGHSSNYCRICVFIHMKNCLHREAGTRPSGGNFRKFYFHFA